MTEKVKESSQKDIMKYLTEYLRIVIPKMVKKFNLNSEDKSHCDFKTFKEVIGNFQIPQKYTEDNILNNVYDKFKNKENNQMNYKNFVDYIIDGNQPNDFFDYKKKFIGNIEKKLVYLNGKIQEKSDALETHSENTLKFAESLKKNIEEKRSLTNQRNPLDDKITNQTTLVYKFEKELNSIQPSLGLINKLFKDGDKHFDKRIEIENSMSANPLVFKTEKAKTRFNGNPPHKNTFTNIAPPQNASSYIDEKTRFDIRCKWDVDFQIQEKNKKNAIDIKMLERKKNVNEMVSQRIEALENYQEQKDNLGQFVRTNKVYNYENVRNFFLL
jgi:hypothetical protein